MTTPSTSRRAFLAASAGAAMALSLRGRAEPDEPKAPRTLRKAVMYGMIAGGSTIEDKFRILRDSGFEGVEMDSPTSLNMADIGAAAEKTGIKVHGLVNSEHWKVPLNAPDEAAQDLAVQSLETCLRDAKTLGSSSILLVPGIVRAGLPYDECWRLTQKNIRRVLPLAKECDVRIGIENVWNHFIMSPLEAARYVDEFNNPLVAWHFDIGNVINYGWPDQWVRTLGKRIVKLHIKDFSRKKRDKDGLWEGFKVELGEGDAGWPAVMKALDEVGYSTAPEGNWATAEVAGGDHRRLRIISEQMDKLFAM
jgi:L-ribulose-5-phosphate 3-epimerase